MGAKKYQICYSFFPFSKEKVVTQFQSARFERIGRFLYDDKTAGAPLRSPEILQFEEVKRIEMGQFVESVKRFFQDSPDTYVVEALEHIFELPARFLDQIYDREKFYFAVREGKNSWCTEFQCGKWVG